MGPPAVITIENLPFSQIWCVDFEFHQDEGGNPTVICMVAREARSGLEIVCWQDDFQNMTEAPFSVGDDSLVVAYYASAEFNCFLALGWPLPVRVLDLFVEFRCEANGLPVPSWGLLAAMQYYRQPHVAQAAKDLGRDLAIRGGPFDTAERETLLAYCKSDVHALVDLLPPVLLGIAKDGWPGLGRALLRGRYTVAAARIEAAGIPIDIIALDRTRAAWGSIKRRLIEIGDEPYQVYEGDVFKEARFAAYLVVAEIPWPRTRMGRLSLSEQSFKEQAQTYPALEPLRQLRKTVGQLRLEKLAIGQDGRNRVMLGMFRSKTGRNQPSNTRSVFGPAAWVRSFIRPEPGRAIAYVDWSSQELGIAAALSGDVALLAAYSSGDPYLAFAIQAGLAPSGATKTTHSDIRDKCKTVVLGVLFGMGASTMADRIGCSYAEAWHLLDRHQITYKRFWRWSDDTVGTAYLTGEIRTVLGWRLRMTGDTRPTSAANFSMQANAAEMLRLACCVATEAGLRVVMPVHDALLIEGSTDSIDDDVARIKEIMGDVSLTILGGALRLRSDAEIVRWPNRFADVRGRLMWDTVAGLVDELAA